MRTEDAEQKIPLEHGTQVRPLPMLFMFRVHDKYYSFVKLND
jgi:hypothetical protein